MEFDIERRLKAPRKIHAPPTHDTISRRIGPGLNPTRELRHLVFRQEGLHPELLSNLVFEDCWSCGDLAGVVGFNSVFECDACDDFGEIIKAS